MALFKTNRYGMERNRVTTKESNDLTVTGVRVLIDLRCSNATEEQILSRLSDVMNDGNKKTSEEEICQRIEKLFKEEFSSVKTSISHEQKKEKCEVICPFAIHVTMDENRLPKIETRPAENIIKEEILEVLTIKVRRRFF